MGDNLRKNEGKIWFAIRFWLISLGFIKEKPGTESPGRKRESKVQNEGIEGNRITHLLLCASGLVELCTAFALLPSPSWHNRLHVGFFFFF